jgi:hypothetical protein
MADAKISELPAATLPLAGTGQVPIVQDGETRRATLLQVRDSTDYKSGREYLFKPPGSHNTTTSNAPAANLLYLSPVFVEQAVSISEIRASHNNAGGNAKLAIYAASPLTLYPAGDPVFASASFPLTLSNTSFAGLSLSLERGWHWAGHVGDGATHMQVLGGIAPGYLLSFIGVEGSPQTGVGYIQKNMTFADPFPTLTGSFGTDAFSYGAANNRAAGFRFVVT